MQIMQMALRVLQMHQPKQNFHCLAESKQWEALAFMGMQIKQYICLKQKEAIFTVSSKPLKLVDQFIYLSSSISSTEIDLSVCLAKA